MSQTTAPVPAETPQILLEHHLKALRLPTFLREYDRVARQCAVEDIDYPRYLLRMAELELLDRDRRATERRIRQAKFPVVKSYFGGVRKGKRGRGAAGKVPVFGLLKRGGKVYTKVIQDVRGKTLKAIIDDHVVPDSIVYSDTLSSYNVLDVSDFKHHPDLDRHDRGCDHYSCAFVDQERKQGARPGDASDPKRQPMVLRPEGAHRRGKQAGRGAFGVHVGGLGGGLSHAARLLHGEERKVWGDRGYAPIRDAACGRRKSRPSHLHDWVSAVAKPCWEKFLADFIGPLLLLAPARRNRVKAVGSIPDKSWRKCPDVVSKIHILGKSAYRFVCFRQSGAALERQMGAKRRRKQCRERPDDPDVFLQEMGRSARGRCRYLESLFLLFGAQMEEALRHSFLSHSVRLPTRAATVSFAGICAGIQSAGLWSRSPSTPG
jgi:transposase-like protein